MVRHLITERGESPDVPLAPYLGILLVVFTIDCCVHSPSKSLNLCQVALFATMAVWMPPGILLILILAT